MWELDLKECESLFIFKLQHVFSIKSLEVILYTWSICDNKGKYTDLHPHPLIKEKHNLLAIFSKFIS